MLPSSSATVLSVRCLYYPYKLNGNIITKAGEEKDLGVWIDNTLKPTRQCEAAAKTANSVLGQITRAFHY